MEQATTTRAAVVVLAKTLNPHYFSVEGLDPEHSPAHSPHFAHCTKTAPACPTPAPRRSGFLKTPLNLMLHLLDGRHQVLSMPFLAGTTHVMGRYGFTQNNFLLEGANRIRNFVAPAIFVYMYPSFRQAYPDNQANLWPSVSPTSLTQLAQTTPYKRLFNMPFRTFVITAYTFANSDNVAGFATNPSMAVTEEKEFYDLTRYLYATYAGTGKTFILKHWEGDWVGLQGYDASKNVSPTMVNAMITWLTARQNAVANARRDVGDPVGIGVFHAVEVNRVIGLCSVCKVRVINAVVPGVFIVRFQPRRDELHDDRRRDESGAECH
jgi:hypothetical protein